MHRRGLGRSSLSTSGGLLKSVLYSGSFENPNEGYAVVSLFKKELKVHFSSAVFTHALQLWEIGCSYFGIFKRFNTHMMKWNENSWTTHWSVDLLKWDPSNVSGTWWFLCFNLCTTATPLQEILFEGRSLSRDSYREFDHSERGHSWYSVAGGVPSNTLYSSPYVLSVPTGMLSPLSPFPLLCFLRALKEKFPSLLK